MMVERAARFATLCHAGQNRKYGNHLGVREPYIMHPARVSTMVMVYASKFPHNLESYIAAAWCHDVLEDCDVSYSQLQSATSWECAFFVSSLTNPSKQYPDKSRQERKAMDSGHLAGQPADIQNLKIMDIIDNLSSTQFAPPSFAKLYARECGELLEVLTQADAELLAYAWMVINKTRNYFS